ncbi:MAG TPA: hypothetical protein VF045_07375 [Acidimicrobiales bacterium]
MRKTIWLVAVIALTASCARADGGEGALIAGGAEKTTTSSTTSPPPTTTSTSTTTTTTTPTTTTTVVVAAGRRVYQQNYTPFASVGGVTLLHPASRVERIGYHESNLDGARVLEPLPTSAAWFVMEGRSRDTNSMGAADVQVDPDAEIRSPVTGTVLYSGTYVLYCKHSDDFLIIEPDGHPGWEVKLLHIDGVRQRPGMRVEAGVTVVASRATRLPFASQVEEGAAVPPWPHVHIEVDDPTIPDRPTPGGGC